jgi:hypothetical protein
MERLETPAEKLPLVVKVRPRFSLRLLLVVFALLALALYLCVVRPTALAEQFVAAVSDRDYTTAQQLLGDKRDWSVAGKSLQGRVPKAMYVRLLPREWGDVYRCRRRVVLTVAWRHYTKLPPPQQGAFIEWTEDIEIFSGPRGLQIAPNGSNLVWPN